MEMRGAMYHGLHHVTLETFEKPEPTPDGIVVKNVRSGICGTDLHAYQIDGPEVGIYPRNPYRCAKVQEMGGILCDTTRTTVPDFAKSCWGIYRI